MVIIIYHTGESSFWIQFGKGCLLLVRVFLPHCVHDQISPLFYYIEKLPNIDEVFRREQYLEEVKIGEAKIKTIIVFEEEIIS